jgi:hypothetical protein
LGKGWNHQSGVPAVSARQAPEAAAVLMQRAAVVGSALEFVEAPFEQAEIGLQGIHQRENAAAAFSGCRRAPQPEKGGV